MVSSALVPFDDRVVVVNGVRLIPVDFFHYTLNQRDELIDEQRLDIIKLKQRINKLEQRK